MADCPSTLELSGVVRRVGGREVLTGIDLRLERGEKALLLGHNGAGKSTLLRTVAGLARPDAGEVLVLGRDPVGAAGGIGYVGHAAMLYRDLSVAENLRHYARLYGLASREAGSRVDQLVERLGLGAVRDERVRVLSHGELKRAAIARALVHDPPLLLLDEPFAALDASAREELVSLLRADRDRTVLLATHQLDYPAESADRVLLLADGRLRHEAPPIAAEPPRTSSTPPSRHRTGSPLALLPALVSKDLRVEWRDGRRLRSLVVFVAALGLVVGRVLRDDASSPTALAAAAWLLALFSQLLFLGQLHHAEAEHACNDGLRLTPVPPWVVSLAKTASAACLSSSATLLVLGLVAFLSGSAGLVAPGVLALLAIETVGIAAMGQLLFAPAAAGEETALDQYAFLLLMASPLVFFGADATALQLAGTPASELGRFYGFLGLYAVALVGVAAVGFRGFTGETERSSPDPGGGRGDRGDNG